MTKAPLALCSECPLQERPCVLGKSSHKAHPRIAIVGDHPYKVDINKKVLFRGSDGYFLNDLFKELGWSRADLILTKAVLCQPPPHFKKKLWKPALDACRPRLVAELESLADKSLILVFGSEALRTLAPSKKSANGWQGYPVNDQDLIEPLRGRDLIVYPMRSIREVLADPIHYPAWRIRLFRARDWLNGKPPAHRWSKIITQEGPEMVKALEEILGSGGPIGVDVETIGDTVFDSRIRCLGVANTKLAVSVMWPPENSECERLMRALYAGPLEKALQNRNFDRLACKANGITLSGPYFDTLTADFALNTRGRHALGEIANREFGSPRWKTEFQNNDQDLKGSELWAKVDIEKLKTYNAKDNYQTILLRHSFKAQLEADSVASSTYEMSMALSEVGIAMTEVGIQVDLEKRKELTDLATETLEKIESDLGATLDDVGFDCEDPRRLAASPAQLKKLFYSHFGLTPRVFSKDTGLASTDHEALFQIQSTGTTEAKRVAKIISAHRGWSKLKNTYLVGAPIHADGCFHPHWKFEHVITFRASCEDPNMQNWPKPHKKEIDGKVKVLRPGLRGLIRARDGMWLVRADKSQLELRIIAAVSGDSTLLEFYRIGRDVHGYLSAEMNGTPEDQVLKHQRDFAKVFNFGDNYGSSAQTLLKQGLETFPGLTLVAVKRVQEVRRRLFPGIFEWQEKQKKRVRDCGYVEMPLSGRKLHFYLNKFKPTEMFNYPIQGTAADLMNPVMLKVAERLRWDKGESLLAQVHDELLLEGPDPDRLVDILKEEMPQALEICGNHMEFPIEVSVGKNWEKMEEV